MKEFRVFFLFFSFKKRKRESFYKVNDKMIRMMMINGGERERRVKKID